MNTIITFFLQKGSNKDKSDTQYFYINVCTLEMLYIDTIDISEETDINKTSASKEWDICHYWYFLNYSLKFYPNIWNLFSYKWIKKF